MLRFHVDPHSGVAINRQMIDHAKYYAASCGSPVVAGPPPSNRRVWPEQVATVGWRRKRLMLLSLVGLACSTLHGGWWDPRFDLPGANGRIQSLVEFHAYRRSERSRGGAMGWNKLGCRAAGSQRDRRLCGCHG